MALPQRSHVSRRDFFTVIGAGLLGLFTTSFSWRTFDCGGRVLSVEPHPDPRPDVDASRVLKPEQLQDVPELIPLYDGIRAIPHIADGIRCHCGCADIPGYRSLLICFEEGGMATMCLVCQTEGRMVVRLHGRGYTLDQIRAAVDARLG